MHMEDDHFDMSDDLSISGLPNLYPISHIDIHIDDLLMSDLPYRSSISISDHNSSLCTCVMLGDLTPCRQVMRGPYGSVGRGAGDNSPSHGRTGFRKRSNSVSEVGRCRKP
jgi:hypothetical protein